MLIDEIVCESAGQTFYCTGVDIDLVVACSVVSNIPQALWKSLDQFGVEASSQLVAFVSLLDCRAAGAAARRTSTLSNVLAMALMPS